MDDDGLSLQEGLGHDRWLVLRPCENPSEVQLRDPTTSRTLVLQNKHTDLSMPVST